ncbi:MAG: HD domain-containing protein, partial [Archaeoglobaceae archaeon]
KKKAQELGEPRRKGVQLADAIGVFERAFRRGDPEEVESELREMLNVQVIVAESKESFERRLMEEEKWPALVTVPYGVFLSKIRNINNVYCVDLTSVKEKLKFASNNQTGVVFAWEIATRCDRSSILPGRTYLLLSKEAGYSEEEGLTFNGVGEETGWSATKDKPDRYQNFGGRYQSFKEHSEGIYNRARESLELYKPFLKTWTQKLFIEVEEANANLFTDNLREAILVAALFHDIGKLGKDWQEKIGWKSGEEFIGRTVEQKRYIKLPKHAPFAYIFIKSLLRRYFGVEDQYGRPLDHIALAAARHHSVEVGGDVEAGFELAVGAEGIVETLAQLVGMKEYVPGALDATKAGSPGDEPPGPSEDFYFLYCIAQRLIKVADWEDAGNEKIELVELRE